MSKPTWLNISPSQGSGNGTIQNSASEHTGRVARSGQVTVTASGVAAPATYDVTQEAKPEFVAFNDGTEMAAPKTAGNLTVKGKSNSSKLTFSLVGDGKNVTIPSSFTAGGVATDNGVAIAGDPGADAEFEFAVILDLPVNDSVEEIERTIKVESDGGQSAQIVIKQAAGDARLSVSPNAVTIKQDGSAVSVNVESNTSWSVS